MVLGPWLGAENAVSILETDNGCTERHRDRHPGLPDEPGMKTSRITGADSTPTHWPDTDRVSPSACTIMLDTADGNVTEVVASHGRHRVVEDLDGIDVEHRRCIDVSRHLSQIGTRQK
eukprot:1163094-Rhodomonas_salina.4